MTHTTTPRRRYIPSANGFDDLVFLCLTPLRRVGLGDTATLIIAGLLLVSAFTGAALLLPR